MEVEGHVEKEEDGEEKEDGQKGDMFCRVFRGFVRVFEEVDFGVTSRN